MFLTFQYLPLLRFPGRSSLSLAVRRFWPLSVLSAGLAELVVFDFEYFLLLKEASRDLIRDLIEDNNSALERKYRRKEAQAGMQATMMATLVSTILGGFSTSLL